MFQEWLSKYGEVDVEYEFIEPDDWESTGDWDMTVTFEGQEITYDLTKAEYNYLLECVKEIEGESDRPVVMKVTGLNLSR
jgi:hypothetical protein